MTNVDLQELVALNNVDITEISRYCMGGRLVK